MPQTQFTLCTGDGVNTLQTFFFQTSHGFNCSGNTQGIHRK